MNLTTMIVKTSVLCIASCAAVSLKVGTIDTIDAIPYNVMNASQSSTHNVGEASKCLTLSPSKNWPGTCTHTNRTQGPWWKVSLSGQWAVRAVKLSNRAECCADRLQNIDVYVGGSICASNVSVAGGATKEIACSGTGSEIKVQHRSKTYFTICGFAAYGAEATAHTDSYSRLGDPSIDFCDNGVISESKSDGLADCKLRCDAIKKCSYISIWSTGSLNWCRLTKKCSVKAQQAQHRITIYAKQAPPPMPPTSVPPTLAPSATGQSTSSSSPIDSSLSRVMSQIASYPSQQFSMYTDCESLVAALPSIAPLSQFPYATKKHNVDVLFARTMITQAPYNETQVRPLITGTLSNASLFIVPVFWTQSFTGRCGNHKNNVIQMQSILNESEYYRRNQGRDHVIVCEKPDSCKAARKLFPNVILGTFEGDYPSRHSRSNGLPGPIVSVGYSTYEAIAACGHLRPLPMSERSLTVFFNGQTVKSKGEKTCKQVLLRSNMSCVDKYSKRRSLWCDWVNTKDKPKGFKIEAYQKSCGSSREDLMLNPMRVDECVPYNDMRHSKMVLSLSGDSPTTDRIFNAFQTLTPIVVLSDEKADIVEAMPAKNIVPWHEILLEVNSDRFVKHPIQAIRDFVETTSDDTLTAVHDLMQKHALDVLWDMDGSSAPAHFLTEALELSDTIERSGLSVTCVIHILVGGWILLLLAL